MEARKRILRSNIHEFLLKSWPKEHANLGFSTIAFVLRLKLERNIYNPNQFVNPAQTEVIGINEFMKLFVQFITNLSTRVFYILFQLFLLN